MTAKPIILTAHARGVLAERGIELEWLGRAVRDPAWRITDPLQPTVERRFRQLAEAGGRIVRVVCVETPSEIRIITAFFDRKAKAPP